MILFCFQVSKRNVSQKAKSNQLSRIHIVSGLFGKAHMNTDLTLLYTLYGLLNYRIGVTSKPS